MKTKKAILFDFDGTLVDTAPDLIDAFNILLRRHQQTEVDMNEIRHMLTMGSRYFINNYFKKDLSEKEIAAVRQEFLDIYSENGHSKTGFFPGVSALLKEISLKQIPWGIVTNKLTQHANENLENLDLPSKPQVLVCGDTLSVAKPDPAPLFHACKLIDFEPHEVIYVGDSDVDATAGLRANIDTVIVEHGYNSGEEQFKELGIAAWIRNPMDVLKWV